MTTSNVVYRFTCTCGLQYIGMSERRLEDRVKEHCPAWLGTGAIKNIGSSICEHIVTEGHDFDRTKCFQILFKVRHRAMLKFIESVAIRQLRPSLNKQRDHVYRLRLPWG